MRFLASLVAVLLVGCVTDPERASEGGLDGKSDQSGGTRSSYRFAGRFRLFHGIDSQVGQLTGRFEMSPPVAPQIDTEITNVRYTLTLEADSYHRAYTLRSTTDRDHSWAEWRTTGLSIFIEHVSALTADAEHSVIDARAGEIVFKFYPYCDPDARRCQPGTLSGFDFYGTPSDLYPTMQLDPIGPFELVAE